MKFLGVLALALIAVVAFAYLGSGLPEANPLGAMATGIRGAIDGIFTSIAGVGRSLAASFGG
ncbi:MAG: hypothetical protein WBM90_14180 [Acidimicrobiia bacterium]